MVPTCTHTRVVSPCFQSSVYSLTSMDDHTCDHAVVDDYHSVHIHVVSEIIVLCTAHSNFITASMLNGCTLLNLSMYIEKRGHHVL